MFDLHFSCPRSGALEVMHVCLQKKVWENGLVYLMLNVTMFFSHFDEIGSISDKNMVVWIPNLETVNFIVVSSVNQMKNYTRRFFFHL